MSEAKNYGVKDLQDQDLNTRQGILSELVGHKLKFEFNEESPVTGVLEGLSGKIGMIKNGREEEGVLVDDIARVTDYGAVEVTGGKQKPTKPTQTGTQSNTKPASGTKQKASKPRTNGESKRAQAARLLEGFTPEDRQAGLQKLVDELGIPKTTANGYFYQLVTKAQNGAGTRAGSKRAQAAELLQDFGPGDRKAGIQKLVDELGLNESTASGYFYQLVTKQSDAPAKGPSKREQAAKLLEGYAPEDRKAGIQKLVDELEIPKTTASGYFYQLVTKPAKQ